MSVHARPAAPLAPERGEILGGPRTHKPYADLTAGRALDQVRHLKAPHLALLPWALLAAIGAIAFAAGLTAAPQRSWGTLLLGSQYLIGLGLGGLFLIACHYLTGACWSVVIRRYYEALASLIVPGLAAVGAILIFYPTLYSWVRAPAGSLHGFKGFWLDYPFLLVRCALYALCWAAFAFLLIRNSRAQDRDGDFIHTRRNIALSAAFVVCFALTCWLSSVDWVMALGHHWYSTIFGVYAFTGFFSSALAATIVVVQWTRRSSAVRSLVRDDHLHDLGKLLLGATTLWAYIWFSQYMLIWYANLPEETGHYIVRQGGLWHPLFLLNPVLNWGIPFLLLLPRASKRNGTILARIAAIVLVGRWLDLYLMIFPSISESGPPFGLWEVGISMGFAGIAVCVGSWALGRAPIVPLRDPHLEECLAHHQ